MASGKPEYLPQLRDFARQMEPPQLKSGMVTWDWGCRNLFLCEYFLLTGDREVLPVIREYTLALAKGQSLMALRSRPPLRRVIHLRRWRAIRRRQDR